MLIASEHYQATFDGRELELTRREFDFLAYLVAPPDGG